MKNLIRITHSMMRAFGLDLFKMINAFRELPIFLRNYRDFKRQNKHNFNDFPITRIFPCLEDKRLNNGSVNGHYFHQDLLVARRIKNLKPDRHVDVGSRIDGFVAHVASFRSIDVIDIRPMPFKIPNINFIQADMMLRPDELIECCDSLSCLHAIEHFGLGRYGDTLKRDGHIKGLENLDLMLKKKGTFFFSTPIGPQRIEFNAHRVFSVDYLISYFEKKYEIVHFSFIDDEGELHEDVVVTDSDIKDNFGCTYGCGIFELTKK